MQNNKNLPINALLQQENKWICPQPKWWPRCYFEEVIFLWLKYFMLRFPYSKRENMDPTGNSNIWHKAGFAATQLRESLLLNLFEMQYVRSVVSTFFAPGPQAPALSVWGRRWVCGPGGGWNSVSLHGKSHSFPHFKENPFLKYAWDPLIYCHNPLLGHDPGFRNTVWYSWVQGGFYIETCNCLHETGVYHMAKYCMRWLRTRWPLSVPVFYQCFTFSS